jgi:hypothetical protein
VLLHVLLFFARAFEREKNLGRAEARPSEQENQRVKGIEPSSVAWKATALPLSYTRAPTKLTRRGGPAKFFSIKAGSVAFRLAAP